MTGIQIGSYADNGKEERGADYHGVNWVWDGLGYLIIAEDRDGDTILQIEFEDLLALAAAMKAIAEDRRRVREIEDN